MNLTRILKNSIVTVKGIVVSSLVNQDGFYLSDGTGIIAVTCSASDLEEIDLGNEVVIMGKRIYKKKYEDHSSIGQTVIADATILTNYYGTHDYDTSKFDTTKTLSDLNNLDVTIDYTTTVYVVTATIKYVEEQHYTAYNLVDSSNTTFNLYCNTAGQYSWLKDYENKEVTLELAVCNWNSKNYYRGCVISLTYNGDKIMNTSEFK